MKTSQRKKPKEPTPLVGRAIVYEPNPSGHRLHYAAQLLKAQKSRPPVLATSSNAKKDPQFEELFGADGVAEVVDVEADLTRLSSSLGLSLSDQLVIPDGDQKLLDLAKCLITRKLNVGHVSVLLMRSRPTAAGLKAWAKFFFKAATATALNAHPRVSVYFLTDAFGVVQSQRFLPGVRPVRDPVVSRQTSGLSVATAIPDDGLFRVGLLGVIDPRKNPQLLLDAASFGMNVSVLIAGRIDADLMSSLQSSDSFKQLRESGRIQIENRFLSQEELDSALSTLDAVALLHDNDAPSGIMAEATLLGVPSLVASGGWLEKVVRQLGIGVATSLNINDVLIAIERLRSGVSEFNEAVTVNASALGNSDFVEHLMATHGSSPTAS